VARSAAAGRYYCRYRRPASTDFLTLTIEDPSLPYDQRMNKNFLLCWLGALLVPLRAMADASASTEPLKQFPCSISS
jgi:hypothetical protein